jgi:hypothetical protein
MDVRIKPLSGCMQIFLGVMTLGVAPLMTWLNERNWPKSLDEQGLVTRGGFQINWNEFTKITKVITNIGRTGAKTEHYELRHPKGKVIVAVYRLENGSQVFDYIWGHLPEQTKVLQ